MTDPELARDIHAQWAPGLRLLARQLPLAVGLVYLGFLKRRRKIDAALLVVSLLLPLTRLARIDIALGVLMIGLLWYRFPLADSVTWRARIMGAIVILVIVVGLVQVGEQRHSRFGLYDVPYADTIDWVGPQDQSAVLPMAYGYYSLSFENLDKMVRRGTGGDTLGRASLEWLIVGLLKTRIFGVGGIQQVRYLDYYVPVTGSATVPTALAAFYLDGGIRFAWLPMLFYMGFWCWIYVLGRHSFVGYLVYSLMALGFSLSAFQPAMCQPLIVFQILTVVILSKLFRRKQLGAMPRRVSRGG
jgi:hypothetical protein